MTKESNLALTPRDKAAVPLYCSLPGYSRALWLLSGPVAILGPFASLPVCLWLFSGPVLEQSHGRDRLAVP